MSDNILGWFLRLIAPVVNNWAWLHRKVNAWAINRDVCVCRFRPHPWSTVSSYISWTSLTDQHYSARHLPAAPQLDSPTPEELVAMFKRSEQEFCTKSTLLFPAFAQYLTDGFIRTRMPQAGQPETLRKQNTSNHQIDLSALYGRTPEMTTTLRLGSQDVGLRGRLKSQLIDGEEYSPFLYEADGVTIEKTFEDLDAPLGIDRLAKLPSEEAAALRRKLFAAGGDRANASPQVAMMNTLFLREHNRLAGEIEKNNPGWDDEQVFQTTRNIVIVMFIRIVVEEYINHISPLPIRPLADPSVAWRAPWNKPNWMTTEFSLLYRWHSLIPDTIVWKTKSYPVGETLLNNQPLLENGLARAFSDMSAQRAGRLGAFNTATALLNFELRAIQQGRLCEVAPYSKYREYVSLPPPSNFSDISSNGKVVDFLKEHYKKPSDVDFYVGLFAEDPVPNSPLPKLLLTMVAVDAFSQALTNPLLSENVFGNETVKVATFTQPGCDTIDRTRSLRDLLVRNCPGGIGDSRISMTWEGWKPT